jgi:predicted enzyme related to lactoylglutathione lyase
VDVSVDDIPKAIAFYEALFGWDIPAGGPEVGGYSIAHKNGRIVAAIGPKMGPPGTPSAWTTYLATDNVDATAAKIKGAGGQVLAEPMDVMSEGRMAIAMDTAGAAFGLWRGANTTGIGLANEPGSLSWNEHMSRDFEASKAFYQAVFGYDYQDMSGDGFKYAMFMVDRHEVGGIGEYPAGTPEQMPAAWAAYL